MTSFPRTALDHVPPSLVDVAETVGLSAAIKLMQHYGGQEVQFPRLPRRNHEVISVLGEEDAYALCHFLSGQRIYVPHGRARRLRHQVLTLQQSGRARRDIARLLGISQRHVRRLANEPPEQMPLFPND